MEKTDVLSYCIAAFSTLSGVIESYPKVKEDFLRKMDAQHDDNEVESIQEAIVSTAAIEVERRNVCMAENSDSGFHQDSNGSVLSSPQLSAFSTYHRPGVAQTSPDPTAILPFNSPCQYRSAFSPYVRQHDNAANEQIAGDCSQCSSSPIPQHSNIWRPFWNHEHCSTLFIPIFAARYLPCWNLHFFLKKCWTLFLMGLGLNT